MLPWKAILREVDMGVEVSAVAPQSSMASIDNLKRVAGEVREFLRKAAKGIWFVRVLLVLACESSTQIKIGTL